MKKIAIYARVSTERQEKQETINSQIDALRDHAKRSDYAILSEYIDDGYSGELLDRPALDKLRDEAKHGIFDAVLVHSPDRLSRKYVNFCIVQEELKKSGVDVIFLNRPDSKDTPEENLLTGVQGLIAEYEKAKIIERTRRGRIHKAHNGIIFSGRAPYGYQYIPADKRTKEPARLEIVEAEAKTVKLIFHFLVVKRMSIRAIARELTRRGIRPHHGKQWRSSSLHRIVRNETYAGVTHYNKNMGVEARAPRAGSKYRRVKHTSHKLRPRDQWIPIPLAPELHIISRQTFDQAQQQITRNAALSPRNVKYQYLLQGLVKCGSCNSPFAGIPCHGKLYYRCRNRNRMFPLPRECGASSVRASKLEGAVWQSFCDFIKDPARIMEYVEKLQKRRARIAGDEAHRAADIDKELARVEAEENRLLDAYRENAMTIDQLKDQMLRLRTRKEEIAQRKQAIAAGPVDELTKKDVRAHINEYCERIERKLDSIKDDFEAKRFLLTSAMSAVTVTGKHIKMRGELPAPGPSHGNIASTSAGRCGRNIHIPFELEAVLR